MESLRLQICARLQRKLPVKLILLLSIALVCACSDPVEIEVDSSQDIRIEGGHQVERVQGQFEFKYGLFNDQGRPSTAFHQGDKIIFCFWIVDNGNKDWALIKSQYEDFFRVHRLEGPNIKSDMGQPHDAMSCLNIFDIGKKTGNILKFELPWTIPTDLTLNDLLWCNGRNAPPLEKGIYSTAFDQSFAFNIGGESFETDVLSFAIDFTVN
jgi:hypothetical protein